jgi:hypothetical protein
MRVVVASTIRFVSAVRRDRRRTGDDLGRKEIPK